ncbi:hypothetical protein CDAR_241281 [Caerostris darwini]|uniref:Uncharacterized protein n=1 Tax=Caerostris darwini TaxID=1538125 RepID=A0AAV4TE24_9ARAC|nr:hypothetical protein CDAR_241281 [Caerostris darwini]
MVSVNQIIWSLFSNQEWIVSHNDTVPFCSEERGNISHTSITLTVIIRVDRSAAGIEGERGRWGECSVSIRVVPPTPPPTLLWGAGGSDPQKLSRQYFTSRLTKAACGSLIKYKSRLYGQMTPCVTIRCV